MHTKYELDRLSNFKFKLNFPFQVLENWLKYNILWLTPRKLSINIKLLTEDDASNLLKARGESFAFAQRKCITFYVR